MSNSREGAHIDPALVRAFCARLSATSVEIVDIAGGVQRGLRALGETWRDEQYRQFEESFQRTARVIGKFAADATKLTHALVQDADRAEAAQNIKPPSF